MGFSALALLCAGAGTAHGATLNVPSSYPTIQSAIDAARTASGADTVSVAPGTYRENLRVDPQALTIRTTAGRAETILDAGGSDQSAIRILGGDVTIEGLTVTGGSGTEFGGRRGGGLQIINGGSGPPAVTLRSCAIVGNTALGPEGSLGGGIFLHKDASLMVEDCIVADNTAGDSGGGIEASHGSTLEIIGGAIRDNVAGTGFPSGGAGGGIEAADATVTIRGTSITGNRSTFAGGGILMINLDAPSVPGVPTRRTLRMTDCEVSGNVTESGLADDQGGGIHLEDYVRLDMDFCRVSGNTADSGGAISSFRAEMDIGNSLIVDNEALNGASTAVGGGGIMSIGQAATVAGPCPVVNLTDSAVFANRTARRGGGIISNEDGGCGGSVGAVASLDVTRSIVSENTAGGDRGGGILAQTTELHVTDSHVTANTVAASNGVGGGILVTNGASAATIDNSTVADNFAASSGAGVYLEGSGGPTVALTGSRIYHNVSDDPARPTGLFVTGPSGATADGVVTDNVIADNSYWQLGESSRSDSSVVYRRNEIHSDSDKVYVSTNPGPAFLQVETVAELDDKLGDRANDDADVVPDFIEFIAAPDRFVARPPGAAVLSYSAARSTSARIAGNPEPTEVPTDALAVSGGKCGEAREYSLVVVRAGQSTTSSPVPVAGAPCPLAPLDTDGDGVPDSSDDCDTVPGPASNFGCPLPALDSDGDGVPDSTDECDTVVGPASNNGCPLPAPDGDGDGVPDSTDECDTVVGPASNNGCPLPPPDGDGDGVPDSSDECDTVVGPASNFGCPLPAPPAPPAPAPVDTDDDGLGDLDDVCPSIAGPPEADGCPSVARTLTVGFKDKQGGVFTGQVRSAAPSCTAEQKLGLFRKGKSRAKKAGVGRTNSSGRYRLKSKADLRPGRYYVVVAAGFAGTEVGHCATRQSADVRVNG